LVQKLSKLVTTRNSVAKVFFKLSRCGTTVHPNGGGVPPSRNFLGPYLRPNGLTETNKILYDNTRGSIACF